MDDLKDLFMKQKLDLRITHGFFERYDIYINSVKQKVEKKKNVSQVDVETDSNGETEIIVHKHSILEEWYWFICLFNFLNFFARLRPLYGSVAR